eukprot:CFRG7707T1
MSTNQQDNQNNKASKDTRHKSVSQENNNRSVHIMPSISLPKVIVVFGATEPHGSSVIQHLLRSKAYSIRAVVGHIHGRRAKVLAEQLRRHGIVMKADFSNIDSIVKIMKDAYGVFATTNYWKHCDGTKEVQEGQMIVNAAKVAGVTHFVWSTLPNIKVLSGGKYASVRHFNYKSLVDKMVTEAKFKYSTFVNVPFSYENFLRFFPPEKVSSQVYTITLPAGRNAKLDMGSAFDTGIMVQEVFLNPQTYNGRYTIFVGDRISINEACACIAARTGMTVLYVPVPHLEFANMGFPIADDYAEMFRFFVEYGYADVIKGCSSHSAMAEYNVRNFKTWLDDVGFSLR